MIRRRVSPTDPRHSQAPTGPDRIALAESIIGPHLKCLGSWSKEDWRRPPSVGEHGHRDTSKRWQRQTSSSPSVQTHPYDFTRWSCRSWPHLAHRSGAVTGTPPCPPRAARDDTARYDLSVAHTRRAQCLGQNSCPMAREEHPRIYDQARSPGHPWLARLGGTVAGGDVEVTA